MCKGFSGVFSKNFKFFSIQGHFKAKIVIFSRKTKVKGERLFHRISVFIKDMGREFFLLITAFYEDMGEGFGSRDSFVVVLGKYLAGTETRL
ncbi:MAG: hypothetical protein KAT00_09600 [Planctomycetes bacterium]|nr:hypothetical protein [Planctomycetota bacterium]